MKPEWDGTTWVVSVSPLVLAQSHDMLARPAPDQAAHDSNLLAPFVTDARLEMPVAQLVILDERAWDIAGNDDLDDDAKIAGVPRRVLELDPPMRMKDVLERKPWMSPSATAPASTAAATRG